jgi:FkbM family methyltransferase
VTEVRWKRYRWNLELPAGKLGNKVKGGVPYEEKLLADIASERPAGTAFDIGAYFGNHSAFMAVVCGLRVHAFESDPDRAALLRRNVEKLGVTVHEWAVGAERGHADWVEGHRARKLEPGEGPVLVAAIDDVLDVTGLAVVKLDIEGMEAAALAGMRNHLERWKPLVYSETHDDGADQAAVLEPLGYRLEGTIRAPSPMRKWRCFR